MMHFEITMLQIAPSCNFIQEFMFKWKFALLKLNFVCVTALCCGLLASQKKASGRTAT